MSLLRSGGGSPIPMRDSSSGAEGNGVKLVSAELTPMFGLDSSDSLPGTLSRTVYNDANSNNNTQDTGETGLPVATIVATQVVTGEGSHDTGSGGSGGGETTPRSSPDRSAGAPSKSNPPGGPPSTRSRGAEPPQRSLVPVLDLPPGGRGREPGQRIPTTLPTPARHRPSIRGQTPFSSHPSPRKQARKQFSAHTGRGSLAFCPFSLYFK